MVSCALLAIIFATTRLFGPLHLGDVFIFLSAVIATKLIVGTSVTLPGYILWGYCFLVIAAGEGLLVAVTSPSWFSASAVAVSLLRVAAMLGASAPIAVALRAFPRRPVLFRAVTTVVTVHAIVALLLYALWLTGINIAGNGHGGLGISIEYTGAIPRARGFMDEPANYGAFQAFGLAWVLRAPPLGRLSRVFAQVVAGAAVVASLSLVAAGVAIVAVCAATISQPSKMRSSDNRPGRRAIAIGMIALALAFTPGVGPRIRHATVERALRAAHGLDTSANARVGASWSSATLLIDHRPATGASIGNLGNAAFAYDPYLASRGVRQDRFSWNTLAFITGSTGVIGLVAWLLMMGSVSRHSLGGALIILTWMFGTSVVQLPTLWVALAMVACAWPSATHIRERLPAPGVAAP